jgi:hypothetical protein
VATAAPLPSAIGVSEVPGDVLVAVAILLVIGSLLAAVTAARRATSDRGSHSREAERDDG